MHHRQAPIICPFMAKLSRCIFTIDDQDYSRLMVAKRAELAQQGVTNLPDEDVIKRITAYEVGQHCKRATRGTRETMTLIRDLIASLDGDRGRFIFFNQITSQKQNLGIVQVSLLFCDCFT